MAGGDTESPEHKIYLGLIRVPVNSLLTLVVVFNNVPENSVTNKDPVSNHIKL